MRRIQKHLAVAAVALCLGLGTMLQAGAHEGATRSDGLGDVQFSVSCSSEAQAKFHRAMALYHSFDWPRGKAAFDERYLQCLKVPRHDHMAVGVGELIRQRRPAFHLHCIALDVSS